MCNAIVQDMNSHLATCSCYCQYCRIATVMSEHKEKCPKFPLQCAYCKLQVLRGNIDEHNEKCLKVLQKCDYCKLQIPRDGMNEHHGGECLKFLLNCHNCGLNGIPRCDMDKHRKECPSDMIQCRPLSLYIGVTGVGVLLCALAVVIVLYNNNLEHCESRVRELERKIESERRSSCIIL